MSKKTLPYISGAVLSLICFFVGSNLLVQIFAKLVTLETEYELYLLWCASGLLLSWIGTILGILLISPRNIFRTIVGSSIGLSIGLALSFIPFFYLAGIVTIYIGSLIGHNLEKMRA